MKNKLLVLIQFQPISIYMHLLFIVQDILLVIPQISEAGHMRKNTLSREVVCLYETILISKCNIRTRILIQIFSLIMYEKK